MFNFFNKPKEPAKLCFATDIHCHVVPGVDDGSPDAATSADLIENMQRWGINRILASPHVTQYTFENDETTLGPALDELKAELRKRGNDIEVQHSAEYRIDDLLMEHIDKGILMPYPNNYLLIENSFLQEPFNLDQLVFDLQLKGYKPILAHPERYTYYYTRKDRYEDLHRAGLLFQINLLSLAGNYGKAERKMAEWLIEKDLVDFVGTDLHRAKHVEAIDSYLATRQAAKDMDALKGRILNDTAFV